MRKKILITQQLPQRPFQLLGDDFELIWPENNCFSRDELIEYLADCDVVVSVFGKRFDDDLITKAPNLKLIANYGVGVDNIEIPVATRHGIVVTNTPDTVTEPTAELAMGLMLCLARRISEFDRALRVNSISGWGVLDNLGSILHGKIIGIIGMGAIGRALAKRALAFGMKIIYHNRKKLDATIEEKYDAKYADLDSILRHADFVSLNVPLTLETRGMIGYSELQKMKSSACIINTARGQVLDQDALIKALQNQEISGAALDVFENEPNVPPALLDMNNVVLVPHVGSATRETRYKMSEQVVGIIQDFFSEMRGLPVVNPDVWQSPDLRFKSL
jgi:glyoxylate reductase